MRTKEDLETIDRMKKFGGGFCRHLAEAALYADDENLRRIKETWSEYWEEYAKPCHSHDHVEKFRLIHVAYGNDTGLVSLVTGTLLMSTWDTNHLSVGSHIPRVTVEDFDMHELFGDEHSWDDVIGMLQQHYRWEAHHLPGMEELRQAYPPKAGDE